MRTPKSRGCMRFPQSRFCDLSSFGALLPSSFSNFFVQSIHNVLWWFISSSAGESSETNLVDEETPKLIFCNSSPMRKWVSEMLVWWTVRHFPLHQETLCANFSNAGKGVYTWPCFSSLFQFLILLGKVYLIGKLVQPFCDFPVVIKGLYLVFRESFNSI